MGPRDFLQMTGDGPTAVQAFASNQPTEAPNGIVPAC